MLEIPGNTSAAGQAWLRLVVVGGLALLLWASTAPILELVEERSKLRDSVRAEVARTWGGPTVVGGPVLSIPLLQQEAEGHPARAAGFYHLLPAELRIAGEVQPVVRYRTIYEVVLYSSRLRMEGMVKIPDTLESDHPGLVFRWEQAQLSLGVPDLKGLKDAVRVNWGGEALDVRPGLQATNLFASGVSARAPLARPEGGTRSVPFTVDLLLNGSDTLHFLPLGDVTEVKLNSSWASPSFGDAFLPDSRRVDGSGFSAQWKILKYNRSIPAGGVSSQIALDTVMGNWAFGVRLLFPVDGYQKVTRSVKYAILFILLTFVTFLLVERSTGRQLHVGQYLLVGVALVVFYTLLLSLSEYVGFHIAYGLAAAAIVAQITLFARGALRRTGPALVIGSVAATLYGILFVILQLQEAALLVGSILLFVVTGILMYFIRGVNVPEAPPERRDVYRGPVPPPLPDSR